MSNDNEQRERAKPQPQDDVGRLRREIKPPELIEPELVELVELEPAEEIEPKPPEEIAVYFLQKLRYHGAWGLAAIVPDGAMTTITPGTPDEVRELRSVLLRAPPTSPGHKLLCIWCWIVAAASPHLAPSYLADTLRAGAPRFGFEADPKLARIDDRERQ
jgi:hypothetical protein